MSYRQQGYDAVMKVALEISTEGKNWSESPAMMAAVPTLAASGAGIGGGLGTEYLSRKYNLIDPDVIDRARMFRNLPEMVSDPTDFLATYTDVGSRLVRDPAMRTLKGDTRTGREVIEAARGGTVGKLLSQADVTQQFDPDSIRHYREFEKGPVEAAREMFRESFGDLRGEMTGDVLGRRYRAGKQLLEEGIDPMGEDIVQQMASRMGTDATPGMSEYYGDLEGALRKSNPELYSQFFQSLAEGGDPSDIQNRLLDPMLETGFDPLQRHVDAVLTRNDMTPELVRDLNPASRLRVLKDIYTPGEAAETPLVNYALRKMAPTYKENVKGYQKLIDPLSTIESYRKGMRNVGRAAGLAGLLGAGAGGFLLHKGLEDMDQPAGLRVSW